MRLGPIAIGEPSQPQTPPAPVFPNATFGAQQQDPSKYAYHAEVQRFRKEILTLKARLMGCELTEQGDGAFALVSPTDMEGKSIPAEPFCNPRGQAALLAFAEERLMPGTTLSNYTEERVLQLLMHDHKTLHAMVYFNAWDWQINYSEWKSIHFSILGMCESAYRRAIDNGERNWLTTFLNYIETSTRTDKAKETPSLLGMFKQNSGK